MPCLMQALTGMIERITFHSPESGFCVLRVKVTGEPELMTVIRNAVVVHAGEYIEAEGEWITDRNYGRQFKAQQLRIVLPGTLAGIEKYLGSGLIKGIGPHFAKKLVSTFGAEILTIIESAPERLMELPGIGAKRCHKITASWAEQKIVRNIMVFLQSHGVGTARAVRIYKTYGESAIEKIQQNPYCLALDIHGIGFKTADELAKRLGVPEHSLLRAQAGVRHICQTLAADSGHCVVSMGKLIESSTALLQIPENIIVSAIAQEVTAGHLYQEIIANDPCLFLAALWRAETGVATHLNRLVKGTTPWRATNIQNLLPKLEQQTGVCLSASQRQAVSQALQAKVLVLTGGPGVGKTTVIKTILHFIQRYNARIALCAPTGRAAKRLSETTQLPAKTIHRLLAFDPKNATFTYHQYHPLPVDIVIVDESSMIDIVLMYQLLKAIPDHAALLLVGDIDQLPSVGPGAVLQDFIESGVVPNVRLTEIFRQAANSHIIVNAHRINQGLMPFMHSDDTLSDFYFITTNTPEQTLSLLKTLVIERVPKAFGFNPVEDIQVLAPMNRGDLGARNLNTLLQQALNPNINTPNKVSRFGIHYILGDKVMQTANNYDKDVFNGDVGRIVTIDLEEGNITVNFDGRLVNYEIEELDELNLAYAISIHKSQGSEYPAVVIPLTMQHYAMLERHLLYTVITRGKRLVIIIGQKKALAIAVKNARANARLTNLRWRLINLIKSIK